jgi:predicted DNA-binding transcriptional regulator AlpA
MPVAHFDLFLKTKQVRERYGGCSHMFIERRLANDPTFPRPIYFGRMRFWKLSELEMWEKAQAALTGKAGPVHDMSAGKRGRS